MAGETPNVPLDDFEAAFSQISEADAAGKTVAPADIKPAVEKTAEQVEAERVAAEATAAETTAAEAAKNKTPEELAAEAEAAAAVKATEDAAAAEAAKVAAAQGDDDLIKRLASVIKRADPQADEAAARAAETQRATQAAAAEAERAAKANQAPQLSAEDLAIVQAFEKDFPDVARAQAIVRRAEYRQVVGHVFSEVEKAFNERLAPIAQLVQNLAEREHVGDLRSVVPDYDKLDVAKLVEWVGKQPAYLRSGMDMVMKSGSAEDVKDLVIRFHTETGVRQGAGVQDPAAAVASAAADKARKTAVASLAPVNTKRSGAVAAAAPTDFSGAFDDFAKALVAQEGNDRFTR